MWGPSDRRQLHVGFNMAGRKWLNLDSFDESVVESPCCCRRFESVGPTVTTWNTVRHSITARPAGRCLRPHRKHELESPRLGDKHPRRLADHEAHTHSARKQGRREVLLLPISRNAHDRVLCSAKQSTLNLEEA